MPDISSSFESTRLACEKLRPAVKAYSGPKDLEGISKTLQELRNYIVQVRFSVMREATPPDQADEAFGKWMRNLKETFEAWIDNKRAFQAEMSDEKYNEVCWYIGTCKDRLNELEQMWLGTLQDCADMGGDVIRNAITSHERLPIEVGENIHEVYEIIFDLMKRL